MAIKKEEQKNKLVSVAQNAASNAVTQYKQSAGRLNNAPLPGATQKTAQAAPATAPPEPTTDFSKYKYDAAANDSYMQALSALQAAQKELPSYAGTYDTQLQDLYNQIVNRDKFQFNLNEDMLYQQYRDRYEQQGAMAMRDTIGQAAALTGGYGSTYAEAVGQQQYNAYLQQLNDVVPELYGMALDQYNAEGDRLMQQYGMLGDMADKEYGRYQDALNQYWQHLSYLQGQADTAYDRGYNEWYDAYKMGTEQDQIAYQRYLDQRNYDYQLSRDAVADDQWQQSFDYGKERDAVADSQWNQQFQYQQNRDSVADDQWQQTFNYGKEQDKLDRQFAAEQFAYQKEQDKYQQGVDAERFAYQKEQDAYDREFAQQQFAYSKEQDAYDREQQAGMTAYEKQLNNYGTLADLITKTGYTPTDAELAAAGMTRAQANAYKSIFVPKSSGGNNAATPIVENTDLEDNPPEEDPEDEEPETFKGVTKDSAIAYLKRYGAPTDDIMDQQRWEQEKIQYQQTGNGAYEVRAYSTYHEYLDTAVKRNMAFR